MHLLKQQRLVVENGRRGLVVSEDAARVRDLPNPQRPRRAGCGLAAERVVQRVINMQQPGRARGARFRPGAAAGCTGTRVHKADVTFRIALYRLSGNAAIEETVMSQRPHLRRAMGAVLEDPEQRPRLARAWGNSPPRPGRRPARAEPCRPRPHRPQRRRSRAPIDPIVLANGRKPRCR
jgi:DNA-binding GntR family transcriptional regulator